MSCGGQAEARRNSKEQEEGRKGAGAACGVMCWELRAEQLLLSPVKCPASCDVYHPAQGAPSKDGWFGSQGCTESLCKSKEVWFISFFPLLTDACHQAEGHVQGRLCRALQHIS